ncbi:MAG: hypothetical protein AB7O52_07320 [Planctomycetota bacterium]
MTAWSNREATAATATPDYAQAWSLVETFHDVVDRVVEERITEREEGAPGAGFVTSAVYTTTHAYDALDRLLRTVDTLGQTARFRYDTRAHIVESSDAPGRSDHRRSRGRMAASVPRSTITVT